MTRLAFALLLAAAARSTAGDDGRPGAARSAAGTPPAPSAPSPSLATSTAVSRVETPAKALPRAAVLEEVSGTVREVDRKTHRVAIDAGAERVTLSLDRNTMVYTPAGLGTVLDISPGDKIRAGRNADFLAYWVQLRGAVTRPEPASRPGQGTGPAGGSGSPARAAPAGGAASAPPPGSAPSTSPPAGGAAAGRR